MMLSPLVVCLHAPGGSGRNWGKLGETNWGKLGEPALDLIHFKEFHTSKKRSESNRWNNWHIEMQSVESYCGLLGAGSVEHFHSQRVNWTVQTLNAGNRFLDIIFLSCVCLQTLRRIGECAVSFACCGCIRPGMCWFELPLWLVNLLSSSVANYWCWLSCDWMILETYSLVDTQQSNKILR